MNGLLIRVQSELDGEQFAGMFWGAGRTVRFVLFWLLLALAAAAIVGVLLWLHERRLYRQLNHLLDTAIAGSLLGETFDESRYSQLENKLYRYLKSSSLTRRQLEADKALIAEMVSDISHQTKTPITNILLYTQLLQECMLDADSRELAGQIQEQSERLHFLVGALIKASRLENGLVAVTPVRCLLAELCAQLRHDLASRAEARSIALVWDIPQGAVCRCDPKWTSEALVNLLDNAIKYMPSGGRVTVSVQQYELFCRIDITDTGIGITEEEQPHVFERFYRSPRVAQQEGVGIGLYLTRRIISEEGGYIKLRSRETGTTFSVFLPC